MLNKILIFWWMALWAILIVENMVAGWTNNSYIFISRWKTSTLVIVSLIVWSLIWYWIKSFFTDKKRYENDENDF